MRIRLPLLVLMLIVAAPGWAAATYEECQATVEVFRELSNTSELAALMGPGACTSEASRPERCRWGR